jgi:2'-5' RNA ligase
MRLFTGIEPSAEVVNNLAPVLASVRGASRGNGVPRENLHITIKFIGAWPEERLGELKGALSRAAWPKAFEVRVAGLMLLPRVLCAQIQTGPELAELAKRTEDALAPLGCARESRAYNPHLTLARPKDDNIGELRRMISQTGKADYGSFHVTEFHLYSSLTDPRGSIYTKLATWRLT